MTADNPTASTSPRIPNTAASPGGATEPASLGPRDALIVVDTQICFCPGGTLPVPGGDRVVPVLNRWIEAAVRGGAIVAASRDWHPPDHLSFQAQGGPWPPHCLRDTPDAAFHPDLRLPPGAVVLDKAATSDREELSAFEGASLARDLRDRGVDRVWVGGLALDYCVKATVLDALAAGFETHLLLAATLPVEVQPGDGERAVAEMRAAGAVIEEGG
jgi:nicotinamidase/pyrazinamidase